MLTSYDLRIKTILQQRCFTMMDQEAFADFSGDRNPMHLDPIKARRTLAGAPVVHGIHLLLWALEVFANTKKAKLNSLPCELTVIFEQFVYVGQTVRVELVKQDEKGFQLEIYHAEQRLVAISGSYQVKTVKLLALEGTLTPHSGEQARDLSFSEMTHDQGVLALESIQKNVIKYFPTLSPWLAVPRVAVLATSSTLVGMICPGLHSIYNRLTVNFIADHSAENSQFLSYRVSRVDPRFRRVQMEIQGGGLQGNVIATARMPPVTQPLFRELKNKVSPHAFAGARVLVIGGSRGLGEFTAKWLAAGGAQVWLSYARGISEAAAVQKDIQDHGGHCEIFSYDILTNALTEPNNFPTDLTHFYYFATPRISTAKRGFFSAEKYHLLTQFYVGGFYNSCLAAFKKTQQLRVFYPSTVYVKERPPEMTEYAMAKAAGEILCADMNRQFSNLHILVERLPRLLTDQTASFIEHAIETAENDLPARIARMHSAIVEQANPVYTS